MSDAWYEGLPDDVFGDDSGKLYEKAVSTVKAGLAKGLGFDDAFAATEIPDPKLRAGILDDTLKVIIAEEHFVKKTPLDELSKNLKVPKDKLDTAKAEMLEDVEAAAVKALYDGLGKGTTH